MYCIAKFRKEACGKCLNNAHRSSDPFCKATAKSLTPEWVTVTSISQGLFALSSAEERSSRKPSQPCWLLGIAMFLIPSDVS